MVYNVMYQYVDDIKEIKGKLRTDNHISILVAGEGLGPWAVG